MKGFSSKFVVLGFFSAPRRGRWGGRAGWVVILGARIEFLRKLPSAAICGVESCLRLTEFLDRRLHVLTEARAERARRRPGERGAGRATKQFLSPDFRQGRAKTPNAQLIG